MVTSITAQPAAGHALPLAARSTPAPTPDASPQAKTDAAPASLVARANPSVQFDPAAGVVVIQFRNDAGKVDLSIPSQQQLQAYSTNLSSAGNTPSAPT